MRFRSSTIIRDVSEQTRISNRSFLKPAGVSKLKLQKKLGIKLVGMFLKETNISHIAVRQFSKRSRMISNCEKIKQWHMKRNVLITF